MEVEFILVISRSVSGLNKRRMSHRAIGRRRCQNPIGEQTGAQAGPRCAGRLQHGRALPVRAGGCVFAVVLHVRGEGGGSVVAPVAHGTLERLGVVVSLHVDLEVVGAGEGRLTLGAAVLAIARVQLHVAVAAALVLEQPLAEIAAEGHPVAVHLQPRGVAKGECTPK